MRNPRQTRSAESAKLLFEQAMNMHQRGRLQKAEYHYRALLRANPDHPDRRLLLGVLRFQLGRNDEAIEQEFIELARSVYKRNDERAAIKQTINTILRSDVVEEKSYGDY